MKQNITPEELDELSNKELKHKLAEWIVGKEYEKWSSVMTLNGKITNTDLEDQRMLLSIGQMIEFLSDNRQSKDKTWDLLEITQYADTDEWDVCTKGFPSPNHVELSVALWEKVKEVLEAE